MANRRISTHIGIYFFSFLLMSCTSVFNTDRFLNNSPQVSFKSLTPSAAIGNSSTNFEFELDYKNAQSVELQNSFLVISYTGGVTCAPLAINNSNSMNPTITLSGCTGDGTVKVLLNPGSSEDSNGNIDSGAVSGVVTVDNTSPTVTVGSPTPTSGDSSTTFSFPVSYTGANSVNLTSGDITVNSMGLSCDTPVIVNGDTLTPTVNISNCSGHGSLGITVEASTSSDLAGNQNLVSSASSALIICPSGGPEGEYIAVPGNSTYGTSNFCVMKYEAKAKRDSDSQIHPWGCLENTASCGTGDWVLNTPAEASTPVSVATGRPWREISRGQALLECQSLGTGFDLITNDEWQTIARNIEGQTSNWEQNIVGGVSSGNGGTDSNRLNQGHADGTPNEPLSANTDDAQSCEGTGQLCNDGAGGDWSFQKRTHNLSNTEVIWDFSANVWEWVKDDNSNSFGSSSSFSQITSVTHPNSYSLSGGTTTTARNAKNQFGPLGDYTSMNSGVYGGLGSGDFSSSNGILRGGDWGWGSGAGLYTAYLGWWPGNSANHVGFRCVYRP